MRLYTYTGVWTYITAWLEKLDVAARRRDRQAARAREIAIARERQRRENTNAAFDERITRKGA
jgi:hypothetical protein